MTTPQFNGSNKTTEILLSNTTFFFSGRSGSTSLSPNISLDVSTYSLFVRVIVFCFYQHSLENTLGFFWRRRSHEIHFHPHYVPMLLKVDVFPAAKKKVFTENCQAGSSCHERFSENVSRKRKWREKRTNTNELQIVHKSLNKNQ